jgi:GNAT superfamily N-acetyltransferase
MQTEIDFHIIKEDTDPALIRIEQTYTDSFPAAEQRDFALVRELSACERRFTLCALLHEKQYAGFLSFWQFDAFAYIEHFAISPSGRNKGLGTAALQQFTGKIHPVILETELPRDEWSRRRMDFYRRLGFTAFPHPYLQPPYRKGEPWLPLCLMSYGETDTARRFRQIRQTLYRHVYNVFT